MTLVSIIGDFYSSVVPIFYEFKDKIKTHIILSDDSKRDDFFARQFEIGVNKFITQNNLKIKNLFYSIDEDNFNSLEKALEFIFKNGKGGEVYINTTDGLATLNTFFSLRAIPRGVKIISYDMFDNEYHVIDINGMIRKKIKNILPIKTHFLLKNIKVLNTNSKIFADIYEREIRDLLIIYKKEYRYFIYEITTKRYLPDRKQFPNVYRIFDKMGLINGHNVRDFFKKVTGEIFEYFVYLQIKNLGFDDVELGIEIENNKIKNEFDILAMKDNHLHIIECKYRKKLDLTPLIYKYFALREIVDDDSKSIIVSLVNKYNYFLINRALTYNIALFGLDKNLSKNIKKFLFEKDNLIRKRSLR